MTTPALPPGFVLDRPRASASPPPPPGFVLDDGADGADDVPQRGFLQEAGRSLGLGGRAVMEGIGGTLGIVTDPLNAGVDYLRNKIAPPEQTMSGIVSGNAPEQVRTAGGRETAGQLADMIGLPKPETATERVSGNITEALSGGAGLIGAGKALAARAPGVGQRVGQMLAAQPATQAVSIVGGSGTAGVTRESGGGQGAQIAATLAGGLAPAAIKTGGSMAVRGLARGGETGREAMEQGISNFSAVGARASAGQAAGNRRMQGMESLLAGAPTSGGVMVRAAEQQADDIGSGLRKLADNFSPNASAERAGNAITSGIAGKGGFKERTRFVQTRLYETLDSLIDPQARVGVTSTQAKLPEINPAIPGAPALSPLFQNSRIQSIERALVKDASGSGAVASRPGMERVIDETRATLQAQADDIVKLNAESAAAVASKNTLRRSLGQSEIKHVPYPSMGKAGIDREIATLLNGKVDGKLPYEALKKLRTVVGQEIENAGLMSDVPRSKWRALYGALAQDMRAAAEEAGPEAVQAWSRANTYTRTMLNRMDDIASVVDKNGGGEKIYLAAMSGTKDGGTTLRKVMQSLDKGGQRAITAAVIKRMGMATPGQQNSAGDVFSSQTFVTNWNRVSPEAKRALFDRHGPKFSEHMDKIARVASSIKDGSKVFANPSGTANRGLAFTYAGSLAGAVLSGQAGAAAGLVGAGAAANVTARALTSPVFVAWLARATEMPLSTLPQQVVLLKVMAQESGDDDAAEIAAALENSPQRPQKQTGAASRNQQD